MTEFTLTELRQILETSSGPADGADWEGEEILDMPFGEVGYDSLALLEMAAQIQQRHGVLIPEVLAMKTPRITIECVNQLLREA
jgi:act minimal PKS acyl carrier protein